MRLVILPLILLLVGCSGKQSFRDLKYSEREMPAPVSDVRLPTKLWNLFENPNMEAQIESSIQRPTEFLPLKVFLRERNKGILGGENHLLTYPAAGGELDLRDYIGDKQGSFYIAFEPDTKVSLEHLRVYLLSDSIERDLDGEHYGTGCNTYFEITTAFKKAMISDGFLVNTTAQRHVSALAGTYFFVIDQGEKLYLTRLTIRDSRYPALQCKR